MPRRMILVLGAFYVFMVTASEPAHAAAKCTSIQAHCAVEIGCECDPVTGRWFYGVYLGKRTGGNASAFNECVSRRSAKKK